MRTDAKYIAMWSGPRNVSTALMRSFGSRADTMVVDEPFYAHYLQETGLGHPGRAEILARHETDWRRVVRSLTGPLEAGKRVFYQKHMAHHLLAHIDRSWLTGFEQAFLIRDPREMLPSLDRVLSETPRLGDTGLPQQLELFKSLQERHGRAPAVVDSADLLADPAGVLRALCGRLDLEFDEAMLSWEPGARATDGCWGPIWYGNTLRSTGFVRASARSAPLERRLAPLLAEARPLYETLFAHRLTA